MQPWSIYRSAGDKEIAKAQVQQAQQASPAITDAVVAAHIAAIDTLPDGCGVTVESYGHGEPAPGQVAMHISVKALAR